MVLRKITNNQSDIETALQIYQSNEKFLIQHLGRNSIDTEFLQNELKEMEEHGFVSNLILEGEKAIGILDYGMQADKSVYLSLMILDSSVQRSRKGKSVYRAFENQVTKEGANSIRIDVVNDHEPNVIPFWKKMGFRGKRQDTLTWGDKTSKVLVMEKRLQEDF